MGFPVGQLHGRLDRRPTPSTMQALVSIIATSTRKPFGIISGCILLSLTVVSRRGRCFEVICTNCSKVRRILVNCLCCRLWYCCILQHLRRWPSSSWILRVHLVGKQQHSHACSQPENLALVPDWQVAGEFGSASVPYCTLLEPFIVLCIYSYSNWSTYQAVTPPLKVLPPYYH